MRALFFTITLLLLRCFQLFLFLFFFEKLFMGTMVLEAASYQATMADAGWSTVQGCNEGTMARWACRAKFQWSLSLFEPFGGMYLHGIF